MAWEVSRELQTHTTLGIGFCELESQGSSVLVCVSFFCCVELEGFFSGPVRVTIFLAALLVVLQLPHKICADTNSVLFMFLKTISTILCSSGTPQKIQLLLSFASH